VNWSHHPCLRFPRVSLLLTALLLVPFLLSLTRVQVSSESRVLLEGDQRNLSSYEKVRQILADVEVVVISMEVPEVFSAAGLDAVRRVSEALERLAGVQDVKSLTHSSKPVRKGLSFDMVRFVPPGPLSAAQMEELKRFCLSHPLVKNIMVSPDARHTLITVTYERDLGSDEEQNRLRRELDEALEPFRREGIRFETLALPLIEEEVRRTLRRDVLRFLPAVLAVLALILWFTFRSWKILLLVVLNESVALLLLPGVIQWAGFSLNVFSLMLFPLLAGVHLTLLAHFFMSLQRVQAEGLSGDDAVTAVLGEVFRPAAYATVTTAAGLSSLMLAEVSQVREFGILGTLGILLIFLLTFGPGLAVWKLMDRCWPDRSRLGSSRSVGARSGRWADVLLRGITRWRLWILGATAACVIVTAFGLRLLRTDIRAVEFLSPESPTRRAVEELDRIYGGINVVQIELDSGREQGINTPEFLRYADSVQRYAESKGDVSGVYSYPQLLAMMNEIWEGGAQGSFRVPEGAFKINLFVLALKTQDYPFLRALSDDRFRTAYLIIRTRDMPSERYLALIEDITRFAEKGRPRQVSVSAAAGIHSILEADRRILRSQWSSAGSSILVIGLVLVLLWRSVWLAGLSLLANVIPVALVIAAAGYLSIPLNSITIMVAAISLGIAVDDSIHFLTYWRELRRGGLDSQDAVVRTLRVKGGPIVFTSAVLMAIFGIFWLASFPPIVHFGVLSAIAFGAALASVLCFLPAVLLGAKRGGVGEEPRIGRTGADGDGGEPRMNADGRG
jgi:predicted RND superfamily exporter protein